MIKLYILMDETIINYYYFKNNNWISKIGNQYNFFNTDANFINEYGSAKPLKLEYKIEYDTNGKPYNNLNIKNYDGNLSNIYIFKPKDAVDNVIYEDYDLSVDLLIKMVNTNDKITHFSNKSESDQVETKYQNISEFDISENASYEFVENSTNFILRPGKWYFAYDSSTNMIESELKPELKKAFLVSSIEIPYIDFLYDNDKILMDINDTTFKELFLTIDNNELINMRSHFSRYFSSLGKSSFLDTNEYMKLYIDFLLWTPDRHNSDSTSWSLPSDYKGITDSRILETPSFYKDFSGNDILYTGYNNNEPGIIQSDHDSNDGVSYISNMFNSNHIISLRYKDNSNVHHDYNTVKNITNNVFKKSDLSKNFMDATNINQDISFINIKDNLHSDIDNWEAAIFCPSGIKLIEGNRNILSSFSDSSSNSGFFMGIVGNGVYNRDNPGQSYIFKDINNNYYPNLSTEIKKHIKLSDYGMEFDIYNDGLVRKDFTMRYKIRKNDENKYDVYVFINNIFVLKIDNGGCKLNDIKYWGTPYDLTNPYKEYGIYDNSVNYPYEKTEPLGFTILLQSIKQNYITDLYRPGGIQSSAFINDIIYKDENYLEILGGTVPITDISLNYGNHKHTENTITEDPLDFTDISVNTVNDYPAILSYKTIYDTNITPEYTYADNMIYVSDTSGAGKNLGKRKLKPASNWGNDNFQVKPLNYSKIFDAGVGRKLILEFIDDFQFYHTNSAASDRLEIVAGDISSNGKIEWEILKNNNQPISWMHKFKNGNVFNDSTPLSDASLRKNSQIDPSPDILYPIIDISSIVDTTTFYPWQQQGSIFGYQDPDTWGNNKTDRDISLNIWFDSQFIAPNWQADPNHSFWSGWDYRNNRRPATRGEYWDLYNWIVTAKKFGGTYYHNYRDKDWVRTWYKIPGTNTLAPSEATWNSSMKNGTIDDVIYTDYDGNVVHESIATKKFILYSVNTYSRNYSYGIYWYAKGMVKWKVYTRELAYVKKPQIVKSYGTHDYNPPSITPTGYIASEPPYGIALSDFTIRDIRNKSGIDMEMNGSASPRYEGRYQKDENGVQVTDQIINTNLTNDDLDLYGSILPMNKERAIDIINFVNKSNFSYTENKNDNRIWKIYTNKRFVRINYFAVKSYTNNKFKIRFDRTLSDNEKNTLLTTWLSTQSLQYKYQKDKGILPVMLKKALENDLCGNQIESICKEIKPTELIVPIDRFSNSNFNVTNNKEVPYISLYKYKIREENKDIIISSDITKSELIDNSYKYDDNRNLRELTNNPNPRYGEQAIIDASNNRLNKIKQSYIYNCKNFNRLRELVLPHIPNVLLTEFVRKTGTLNFEIDDSQRYTLSRNIHNYWLGDFYKTYLHLYLYVWRPYSNYLGKNIGKLDPTKKLSNTNIDSELLRQKINVDYNFLSETLNENNTILWKNNHQDEDYSNHENQFDYLYEIRFDKDTLFYGKNSVGYPFQQIKYTLKRFLGTYIFYWSYKVFQPDGIFDNVSPLEKFETVNTLETFNINAQIFNTSELIRDDYIYDTNAPILSWDNIQEDSLSITLDSNDVKGFKDSLTALQLDFKENYQTLDISAVELYIYLWTPNNCKYDNILGETPASANPTGWLLPDDYTGDLDPRITQTPYKLNNINWNPSFYSTSIVPTGTTHYGFNFDDPGTLKKTHIFKKKSNIDFNIDNSISDISINNISWNITKSDIHFTTNDQLYNSDQLLPNTLEYLKKYRPVPYISRWGYTIYDTSNNKIESRIIKVIGEFGNSDAFEIKFKFSPNYYFELNTNGMNNATTFRELLRNKQNEGLSLGYKRGTNYVLIKVDGIIYQLIVKQPPKNYSFFQLDENGNDLLTDKGNIDKMSYINYTENYIVNENIEDFNIGLKIDGHTINLNANSDEKKYILYIRHSTPAEKIFFNKMEPNRINQLITTEIRNKYSDWEPIITNNYDTTNNEYKYGTLFSTSTDKKFIIDTLEGVKIKIIAQDTITENISPGDYKIEINDDWSVYMNKDIRITNAIGQVEYNKIIGTGSVYVATPFKNYYKGGDKIEVIEEDFENEIDPCNRCRPINHSSSESSNRNTRYANRANQSRSAAARTIGIGNGNDKCD